MSLNEYNPMVVPFGNDYGINDLARKKFHRMYDDVTPEKFEEIWKRHISRMNKFVVLGQPTSTKFYSVDELESEGMVSIAIDTEGFVKSIQNIPVTFFKYFDGSIAFSFTNDDEFYSYHKDDWNEANALKEADYIVNRVIHKN